MDDDKIKEGSIICKVNKKRVDPPSEDSETPLDGAVLPPSSDDVGTLSIEPPSFSTDIPPASDGKNEENVQHLPFCSDDIVLDLRMLSSGGDSQNCIPKKFESELDDKMPSIKKLDANQIQFPFPFDQIWLQLKKIIKKSLRSLLMRCHLALIGMILQMISEIHKFPESHVV